MSNFYNIIFNVKYGPTKAQRVEVSSQGMTDDKEVPPLGTVLYILVEYYTEGNTFNTPEETCEVEGWYLTYEEAEARSKSVPIYTDFFGKHVMWKIEVTRLIEG